MVRKRQNSQESLMVQDAKFAPSRNCESCGQPTLSVAVKCRGCMEKFFLAEELAFTREWLRVRRELLMELGHDKRKLVHLVLLRASVQNLGWCGAKVTQVKAKRERVPQGMFPPGICAQCFQAYESMGL